MKRGDGVQRLNEASPTSAMVAEYTPVLEPGNSVLDARPTAAMPAPSLVPDHSTTSKHRGDELRHSAIAAIGEHTPVLLTSALDLGAAVMNRIVSVAGSTSGDRDHVQIGATDEDLRVARPAVALGLRGDAVIARGYEGAIDDPRLAAIATHRRGGNERGDSFHDIGDDALRLRSRDGKHRRELSHGEVRAQARARDHDPLLER